MTRARYPRGCQGRIILVRIEVGLVAAGFVGVWNSIPPQSQIQGQLVRCAPVVLEVEIGRNGVPMPLTFVSIFVVALGSAEDKVGIVEPCG